MLSKKPVLGWNSWNTFGKKISEQLIIETADAMVNDGYLDAGYNYLIIDDCWSLKQRVNGKLVADPELFPHGMKYLADYIHSKGLKFGMYSCAGFATCAGYPSSYGHEFEDARQFAQWEVDYLKYDYCNFPESADTKNAYLTMAMALRSCGREIMFAACNWGEEDPAKWMRSHGAHTYRSTGDIADTPKSYMDIFLDQYNNVEGNAAGCYNDMDMLIVGMHGNGNVGLLGCTDEQYSQHFAMWAFLGSPLIIGADIRNIDEANKGILLNKRLIDINQDDECRPPFCIGKNDKSVTMCRLLSHNKFAVGIFSLGNHEERPCVSYVSFDDLGIHSEINTKVHFTNAVTGEDLGLFEDGIRVRVPNYGCLVLVGEMVNGNL